MSTPIYFGDIDTNLISPGTWPKPNPKGPETKNFLVDLIYNSYQVGMKISTPLLAISGDPEKNTNIKAWELKVGLDNFYHPSEVHQVEFNKKIKEVEQLGMVFAPRLIENLGVSKDTPLELGPCIYFPDSVKYAPSLRFALDNAKDAEGNTIAQQFRSTVENPLFVRLDTDKMLDVTPANIKDIVKVGCKCQMALIIKGWTYRHRKEDKAKGLGEAVIVRLKLAPFVIGLSDPPAPEPKWNFSFSKIESESKTHHIAEAAAKAALLAAPETTEGQNEQDLHGEETMNAANKRPAEDQELPVHKAVKTDTSEVDESEEEQEEE